MRNEQVCTTCHHVGRPKKRTKGNFLIELILWLCFIIPGLLYSIWRVTTRYRVCTRCGSTLLVPKDSPAGAEIINRNAGRG